MKYIWINPVAEHMYDRQALECFLARHELVQVRCNTDWGSVVKEKYRALMDGSRDTVADVRCPIAGRMAADYRREREPGENEHDENVHDENVHGPSLLIPDIEPILIHCAREISGRDDLKDGEKIITTPCCALADAGNALKLKDTRFVTWNGLLGELEETVEQAYLRVSKHSDAEAKKVLNASPIPPGFFKDLKTESDSLTGEGNIREYLEKEKWKKVRLMEMLYCHMGCHNGDGVITDEN